MSGVQVVLAVVFFAVLGGIYALAYYLNHRTPKPAGCEDLKPSWHIPDPEWKIF